MVGSMSGNMEIDATALLLENERLKAENLALREQIARQQEQIAELMQKVAMLEERLRQNSSNSSKPPSQDPPSMKRAVKKPTGRARGGQPGHKGVARELLPSDQVDHTVEVKPEVCHGCGERLEGEDAHPGRHQVIEIPEIRPWVTEYRVHELVCPCCGERNFGELPEGVPPGAFGVRLLALVGMLSGVYRISRRNVSCLLSELFGVEMGTGSVSACEKKVSQALATPVDKAKGYVQAQKAAHADETSWREGRKKAWLWVAVSGLVTIFMIHAHRSQEAARALLGAFAGILVSDRYSAYTLWKLEHRQVCWAHLRRDFKAMSERSGVGGKIGKGLFEASHRVFEKWHRFREGVLAEAVFREEMARIRASVDTLLREGAACTDQKVAGQCSKILTVAPALWTFVHVHGVEPTNNAAERAVRPGVLWRKGCFGTDSAEGSRFAERIMTVSATCRQQKRNVLEFLVQAVEAHLGEHPAPSLLSHQDVSLAQAA